MVERTEIPQALHWIFEGSKDISRLQTRVEHRSAYQAGIWQLMHTPTLNYVWDEVEKLLIRKSVHVSPDYDIPPYQRVAMTQLSAVFSTGSVAEFFDVEYPTAINIIKETVSGLVYILGDDNKAIPLSDLDVFSHKKLAQFERLEAERLQLAPIINHPQVRSLLDTDESLKKMLLRQLQDGAISFYFSELGLEGLPINIDRVFSRFANEGEYAGVLLWIRRGLYKRWSDGAPFVNQHHIRITKLLENIHHVSMNHLLVPKQANKQEKAFERNVRHFLAYINFGSDSTLQIAELTQFVKNFVQQDERTFLVSDISKNLTLSPNAARKVYDAGLRILDYILLAREYPQDPSEIYVNLRTSKLDQLVKQYSQIAKQIHRFR